MFPLFMVLQYGIPYTVENEGIHQEEYDIIRREFFVLHKLVTKEGKIE